MTTPDPSREAFLRWFAESGMTKFQETAWAAWQAAVAHKGEELEQAHEARRQAQTELAEIQELRNRIGLDIDRALRGAVNEQSPIAGRLKLIAQKAGQWKPWPMG